MLLDDAELERQLRETMERAATPVLGEGVDEDAVRQEVEQRQAARQRKKWGGRLGLSALAVAAAVAAVMFVATRPEKDDVEVGPSKDPDRVTTSAPEPSTTLPQEEASTTTAPSTTTSSSTTSTSSTTTTSSTLPEFPAKMDVVHGSEAWAVYLAIVPEGEDQAPELAAAGEAKVEAGYSTDASGNWGSLGCDWGAPEALGRETNSYAVAEYFETEAIANQAREAFEARGHEVVGIAYVTTGCLD